jgi:thiamine biosynthesis protein ThiS
MKLVVNGEGREFADGLTVAGLLETLGVPSSKAAVERNLEIVPRSLHAVTGLSEGDRIEIVHFVGGG